MRGMKPNFALKLSNDGIELLHRSTAGWQSVGTVDFANDDVSQGCARLLEDAATLAPEGIRTKLVLPDSEVRYTSLVAPGPTDQARRYQIEAELEALTPYSIDELAYDWSVEEDYALVAICARETLNEAESFAEGYGFNPVSFVALAPNGEFNGEPFLGETLTARTLLADGDTVQRDVDPVRVTGKAKIEAPNSTESPPPEAKPAESKTAEPKSTDPKPVDPKAQAAAPAASKPAAPKPAAPQPAALKPEAPDAAETEIVARKPAAPKPVAAQPADKPKAPEAPKAPDAPKDEAASKGAGAILPHLARGRAPQNTEETGKDTGKDTGAKPAAPVASAKSEAKSEAHPEASTGAETKSPLSMISGAKASGAKVGGLVRRMGTNLRREKAAEAKAENAGQNAAGNAGDLPPAAPKPVAPKTPIAPAASAKPEGAKPVAKPDTVGEGAAPAAFASRRQAEKPTVAASTPKSADQTGQTPGGRLAVLPQTQGGQPNGNKPPLPVRLRRKARRTVRKALGLPVQGPGRHGQVNQAGPGKAGPNQAVSGKADLGKAAAAANAGPQAKGQMPPRDVPVALTPVGANRGEVVSEPIVAASRPPADQRAKASEAEALTIFGARGNQPSTGNWVQRGFLAGGAALLLGLAVAIWMLYFNGAAVQTPVADGAGHGNSVQLAGAGSTDAPSGVLGSDQPVDAAASGDAGGITAPEAVASTTDPVEAQAVAEAAPEAGTATDPNAGLSAAIPTDPDALIDRLVEEAIGTPDLDAVLTDPTDPVQAAQPETTQLAETEPAQAQPTQAQPQPTELAGATGMGAASSDSPAVAQAQSDVVRMSLPSGLDVPATDEVAFNPPSPPPPFGAEFTLNEQGLVEATPDGALTPSGVTVFAGRPAAVPGARPAAIAALAPQPVEPEVTRTSDIALAERLASEGAEVTYDDTPREDPALAGARPRARTARIEALAPQPAATETPDDPQQDAALSDPVAEDPVSGDAPPETQTAELQTPPPGGVSLRALRPQPRPTDLVQPTGGAADAAAVDEAVTAALNGDSDGVGLEGSDAFLEEAVARSLVPGDRPADLAERAERVLAALRENPAPDESGAGETASRAVGGSQPSIPSSASVARQATERNAIRLGRLNLIGVFGTDSRRRALVRTSSGRVRRVEVGDRLDGGRVTAIGSDELIYTKNGRTERLELAG